MSERRELPGAHLLPHRGTALFAERVLDASADALRCRGRVPTGSVYARQGRVPALLGIELAAQAIGLHEAYRRAASEPDAGVRGYLVAVREAELLQPELAVGAELEAEVRRVSSMASLSHYEITVRCAADLVLRGVISTYLH